MTAAKFLGAYQTYFLLLLVLVLLLCLVLLGVFLQSQKKKEYGTRNNSRRGPRMKKESHVYSPSTPPEGEFEKILDFVLRYVSGSLATHYSQLAVPNIQHAFPVAWGIFNMQCNLSAKRGAVGDISSLFRDGPARVHEEMGDNLVIDAAVGLRDIQLRYNDYSLTTRILSYSGSLQVNAAPVSLRMRVLLRPPFVAELQSLRVENLGPVKLGITGLGLSSYMLPYAEDWINKNAFTYIQDIALKHISHAVKDTLQSFSRRMETIPQLMISQNYSGDAQSQQIAKRPSIKEYERKSPVKPTIRCGLGKIIISNENISIGRIGIVTAYDVQRRAFRNALE